MKHIPLQPELVLNIPTKQTPFSLWWTQHNQSQECTYPTGLYKNIPLLAFLALTIVNPWHFQQHSTLTTANVGFWRTIHTCIHTRTLISHIWGQLWLYSKLVQQTHLQMKHLLRTHTNNTEGQQKLLKYVGKVTNVWSQPIWQSEHLVLTVTDNTQ